jgi:hypothetical protein
MDARVRDTAFDLDCIVQRPFYFITVVWGRKYTERFLQYCVGSLLAQGNLPSLRTGQRSKFLIATLPSDWDFMKGTAIFREMERYLEPVFIEIPPCPPGTLACLHMGVGHVAACDMAFRDNAYGVILAPDTMISDGTVRNLQKHAAAGVEIVWVSALRFAQEPLFENLRASGVVFDDSASGKGFAVSGSDLVRAGVNAIHSETLTYEWDSAWFLNAPSAAWWRVPGEDGLVVHCLSWAPLLLDFSAMAEHDMSTLENWTIDGDYVFKNFGAAPKMHVVQDSDEMFYCGWSALAEGAYPLTPRFSSRFRWMNDVAKADDFRAMFYSSKYDPLKQRTFFLPVRWHARPINSAWHDVERRAQRVLRFALSRIGRSPVPGPRLHVLLVARYLAFPLIVYRRMAVLARAAWKRRRTIAAEIRGLLAGKPRHRAGVVFRLRQVAVFVLSGRALSDRSEK